MKIKLFMNFNLRECAEKTVFYGNFVLFPKVIDCIKNLRIRTYYGPHFPAFRLNTERYRVFLRIQSVCRKIRTRITPNTDIFHAFIVRRDAFRTLSNTCDRMFCENIYFCKKLHHRCLTGF